jgi:hypothetical protein
MLKRICRCAFVLLLLAQVGEAQGCAGTKGQCVSAKTFVQIGATGTHEVSTMAGGSGSAVVEVDPPDADGVVRKKLGAVAVYDDIELTFNAINPALSDLIDAFLDGRRFVVDLITADQNFTESYRARATDAQVLSIAMVVDATEKRCRFTVALRARTISKVVSQTKVTPSVNTPCMAADTRLTIDQSVVQASRIDSLILRGNWIKGEAGTGFTFPNLRVRTRMSGDSTLRAWYDGVVVLGQVANQTERSLSLEFLPHNLQQPALLRFDARGVGMVAMRRSLEKDSPAMSDFELYVEEWDRQGRPRPTPMPPSPPNSGGAPPNGGGAPPLNAGADSSEEESNAHGGTGSFHVKLPTALLSGTGSLCAVAGDGSTFVIQLNGSGGIGIIGGTGQRLRVGTFAVGEEAERAITMGFAQSAGLPASYTAKRGTLTITKVGARTSGRFRVVAGVADSTGEAKETTIAGSFTDLPKHC